MKYRGQDISWYDWIQIFAIFLMLISTGLFVYYYVIHEVNECTIDPLKYSIENNFNESYDYAVLKIYKNYGDQIPIKTLELNHDEENIILCGVPPHYYTGGCVQRLPNVTLPNQS